MPEDNENILDDLLSEGEGEKDDDIVTAEETKALKDELAGLKKENHGLLTTVKKERSKRQNSDGRLQQLTETVNGIIEQNKQATLDTPDKTAADSVDGIKILYNDEGEPYLPTDAVDMLFSQQRQEIAELRQQLGQTTAETSVSVEIERKKQAIIGKDPSYGTAHAKYQTARDWLNERVHEWQISNGKLNEDITSGMALDSILDETVRNEFATEFPGYDLRTVVTAEDSFDQFESMLADVSKIGAEDIPEPSNKPDSRFQQVLNKPSTLGKTANAKIEPTIIDKAGNLSSTDLMDLNDAQIRALEKAMMQEEKNEGVKF